MECNEPGKDFTDYYKDRTPIIVAHELIMASRLCRGILARWSNY